MNLKGMIVSIVTAMLVMTMFASSAMAITVDGRIDPSDEWNSWKLADDEDSPWNNGYDLHAVWQHYDASEDKLYFRYDTDGIAGDSDGTQGPNLPAFPNDQDGVGDHEQYLIGIDADNNPATGVDITLPGVTYPGFELLVDFHNNIPKVYWYDENGDPATAPVTGFVAEAKIATTEPYTHVVEFSINKVSGFMDHRLYSLYGYAGSSMEGYPEDPLLEPFEVVEFDFDFEGICCYNMEFNGTMSFGSIVNHTWDFGDGDTSGVIAGSPGVIPHQYTRGGLPKFTVTLSGYNALGQYAEVSKEVYVDKGPTAKATVVPTKVEVNTPTSVKFDGSASRADLSGDPLRTITYEWSFGDGTHDSGAIVYKTVNLDPHDSLSATLTVNDSHCEDDFTVYVTTKPPQEVPLLTLPGLLALIGMMCIVGAGRILTKGRRS